MGGNSKASRKSFRKAGNIGILLINSSKQLSIFNNVTKTNFNEKCRERWANHLDPKLKRTPWTNDEDKQLLILQKKHGNRWSKISQILKGRRCVFPTNCYTIFSVLILNYSRLIK